MPPDTNTDNHFGLFTNGLDCLVFMLRTIFSRDTRYGRNQSPEEQSDEQKNSILRFCWSSFDLVKNQQGVVDQTQHHILAAEKKYLLREFLSQRSTPQDSLTALKLMDSDIMNETLWSQPSFRLYDTII